MRQGLPLPQYSQLTLKSICVEALVARHEYSNDSGWKPKPRGKRPRTSGRDRLRYAL